MGTVANAKECALKCDRQAQCDFFLFGFGSKQGKCVNSGYYTSCPRWVRSEYDLYRLRAADSEETTSTSSSTSSSSTTEIPTNQPTLPTHQPTHRPTKRPTLPTNQPTH